jgi:hypothetical protein
MSDPAWYSVLPPVLAIVLAIWSKQVILSLFAGIWMGHTLLSQFNPLTGVVRSLDGTINVFTDPGDARVLVFTLLIGPLIRHNRTFWRRQGLRALPRDPALGAQRISRPDPGMGNRPDYFRRVEHHVARCRFGQPPVIRPL